MFKPPGDCPVCGEFVPRKAAACPECGACARSGWNEEDSLYDGLDLPDEDFDYDEFAARELGERRVKQPWWWYVAIVLVILFLLGLLAR